VADPEALAAEGQLYPLLRWQSSIQGLWYEDDEIKAVFSENFTVQFADGVELQPGAYSLYGGMNPPNPTAVQEVQEIVTSSSTPTAATDGEEGEKPQADD
jgi:hypothetical protein